ncbi:DUF4044 domain-containing protein [Holzapfeliella sp. He02]|uniref:DUF4044 domain-containing protein n=1 Tax=Holzapfeliella saturejae TaxID=3082953 RepID=A0ABU8SG63_9LACO
MNKKKSPFQIVTIVVAIFMAVLMLAGLIIPIVSQLFR